MTPPNAGALAFPRFKPLGLDDLEYCSACHQPMAFIEGGQTTHLSCDPPAGDAEVAVGVIRHVWPDAEVVAQWLAKDELFPGSSQCKDCGDPLNGPGLMQRCRGRHNERTAP
jgi:hypothetical protein